jgi:hypothetical protein
MDSKTGELCEIFCCYEPIEISPIPTLTIEQLAEAVTSYFTGLEQVLLRFVSLMAGRIMPGG